MKKVLMIAFFFPPLGGGGVQRSLKFARYLPNFGWHPLVLTVKNWRYHAFDNSGLKDIAFPVYRAPVIDWEAGYEFLYKFRLNPIAHFLKNKEPHWLFPDRMIGWFPRAYSLAKQIIKKEKPGLIYTTSPPNTSHLIGYFLKRKTALPWIADFRDEWSDYQFVNWPNALRKIHRIVEKRLLKSADAVISVTPVITEMLKAKCTTPAGKFYTIFNGYDANNLAGLIPTIDNQKFKLIHTGTFYGNRNPNNLITALNKLVIEKQIPANDISMEFIGNKVKTEQELPVFVQYHGYLPHKECLRATATADVLLLIQSNEGKTGIPGKVFEYLALQKPILALIPLDSMLHQFLKQFGITTVCQFDDIDSISGAILSLHNDWKNKRLQVHYDEKLLSRFERKSLTGELAKIFDLLTT